MAKAKAQAWGGILGLAVLVGGLMAISWGISKGWQLGKK